MEELYAAFLLWYCGLCPKEQYEALLHRLFLAEPDSDLLLDLEEATANMLNSRSCFLRYWAGARCPLDDEPFGRSLFRALEQTYREGSLDLATFGQRCYALWQELPGPLQQLQPFWTLSYADDCLSWGDEAQTRQLYEAAFAFYH